MAEELKDLIRQRGTYKGRLTKYKEYLSSIQQINTKNITTLQLKELSLRLSRLEALFSGYDTLQTRIEMQCSNLDEQIDERELVESQFISLISMTQELIDSHSMSEEKKSEGVRTAQSNFESCSHSNIRLPTINLPTFNGNYLLWLEFRDTFESLIHLNESIPEINKFHYLRSSLEGSATVIIKSIEFTANNYKTAWELLCERYDNKNLLINNHMKALFTIDPLSRESHRAIRFLIDHVTKNLRALNTLGRPTDSWDDVIIYLVGSKLDTTTSRKWEEFKVDLSNLPTLQEFLKFLRHRADVLETMQVCRNDKPTTEHKPLQPKGTKSFVVAAPRKHKSGPTCPVCLGSHRISECIKFKDMNVETRSSEALKLHLCLNCLRQGHNVEKCRLGSCQVCKARHNTLLHNHNPKTLFSQTEINNPDGASPLTSAMSACAAAVGSKQVLLCTALIKLTNQYNNKTHIARALLDAGSQSSFISFNMKRKLGFPSNSLEKPVCVFGINNLTFNIKDRCELTLSSLTSSYTANISCLVVPQVTGNLPNGYVNASELNIPAHIQLADPGFHRPSEVDLLLGADVFFEIMTSEKIKLGLNKPILQSSKVGWLVAGTIGSFGHNEDEILHCNFTKQISHDLARFWELEDLPSSSSKVSLSLDDDVCEKHFIQTTQRLDNGRFLVKMPLRQSPERTLGDSFNMAKKRFISLEKKLMKNPVLKTQYCDFIREYEELGHLNKVNKPDFGYFAPHHAVLRDSSETTKLRVVFDFSAKSSSQKSLNDLQYIGPVVQDELFDILIRFRQHNFVLSGDIQKMYRQIMMDNSQRHLQCMLWRDDVSKPLEVLQLNTLSYGCACAPFLSTRCLLQLAKECNDKTVSEIIEHDFYYDDFLSGAECESELRHIYQSVTETLASACFSIHKFRTNCPQIFDDDCTLSQALELNKQSSVLGLIWLPKADSLQFSVKLDRDVCHVTKRTILSNTCKIFDPLGLLSACTIKLKMLLQKLWLLELGWDDAVPLDIKRVWNKTIANVSVLANLKVPRHALCTNPSSIELHCFVDASKGAYGSCLYVRSIDNDGNVSINLFCAKTRVAPLKTLTIPRLELSGALLGARLVAKVKGAIRCRVDREVFWTDSSVVLGWIRSQPKMLKAFVCNRINEIHELTSRDSWRHVPTSLNPADLASRGVDPEQLQGLSLWWHGPTFLMHDENNWPLNLDYIDPNLPERKTTGDCSTVAVMINIEQTPIIEFKKYSKVNKLKRIVAYILRFIHNCQNPTTKTKGYLQIHEIKNALTYLLKLSQNQTYATEICLLNEGKKLKTKCYLLQLAPFMDSDGLIRVGGRLQNADCDYDKKHPILLDGKHDFTRLLMEDEHLRLLHAGPQLLLSSIREQFWPVGGRTLAREVVRKCYICTRLRGKAMEPLMGNLPADRVTAFYPFQVCGLDFAGPFLISSKKGKGNRITKCYLNIIVCFATKAVHLEVVSDLSTNAFILSLRRFVGRRCRPHTIYCDNGTNFVGANNELGRMLRSAQNSVYEFANDEGIKFLFSPPYSPTFGGIWEAGVKSAKFHLKRIMGNASLTFEELSTLFIQIEAILNSRPLSPLSSDPNDSSPLTPGHFLVGRPMTSLPSPPITIKNPDRYQRVEQLRQHFWQRWSMEYLSELQQRTKWRQRQRELRTGDLVVFKEENTPPLKWKLGRVQQLYPGADGVSRVADFTTQKGVIRRALNRVCPLPTHELESSSFQGGQGVNATTS